MTTRSLPKLETLNATTVKWVVYSLNAMRNVWQSWGSYGTEEEAKDRASQFRSPTRIAFVRTTVETLDVREG